MAPAPRSCPGGWSRARSWSRSTRSWAWPTASWSAAGSASRWWRCTTTSARGSAGPTSSARRSTASGSGSTAGSRIPSSPGGGPTAGRLTSRPAEVHLSRDARTRPPARAIRAFEMAANHSLPPPRPGGRGRGDARPAPGAIRPARPGHGRGPPVGRVARLGRLHPRLRRPALAQGCWLEPRPAPGQRAGPGRLRAGPGPGRRSGSFTPPRASRPASWPRSDDPASFILSADGRLIARQRGERQLEVRETVGRRPADFVTSKGKTHPDLKVKLGRYGMVIHVGKLCQPDPVGSRQAGHFDDRRRLDPDRDRGDAWAIDRPATRSIPGPGCWPTTPADSSPVPGRVDRRGRRFWSGRPVRRGRQADRHVPRLPESGRGLDARRHPLRPVSRTLAADRRPATPDAAEIGSARPSRRRRTRRRAVPRPPCRSSPGRRRPIPAIGLSGSEPVRGLTLRRTSLRLPLVNASAEPRVRS